MTALALERRDDWRLWALSAAVIVAVHLSAALLLATWHEPLIGTDLGEAVDVDLTALEGPQNPAKQDITPGIEQQYAPPVPQEQPREREQKIEEKVEPPPPLPNAEVVLPKETPKPVEKPKEHVRPPSVESAPARTRPSAYSINAWKGGIVQRIIRERRYPQAARAQNESGKVTVAFLLDRSGNIVRSSVMHSSGHSSLDEEALAMIRRAAPFPAAPPGLPDRDLSCSIQIPFVLQ
ncbi:MAG TPA: energy transducer TonB [Pseudolabrys sp.]|nr:energy transducer TonB [Pseudolabrys sp.]